MAHLSLFLDREGLYEAKVAFVMKDFFPHLEMTLGSG